jgi:alkylhydroperoxidase/carboxymuconolactone decarboxylase family protein YurZ
MALGQAPVMGALVEINATSLARTELDPRSLMLVRLGALAAVDAPTASYLLHIGPSVDAGLSIDDVEDVLVAIAPIVGTPRTTNAAVKLAEAFDMVIDSADEDASIPRTSRTEDIT